MRPGRRAVIYTRISRNPSQDELGVERQLKECRTLAKREGLTVVAEVPDNDRSAYTGKRRPGWEAVLAGIEAGTYDTLVAWHPDRLTRHPRELEDLVTLLDTHDVTVRTVVGGEYDLSTASGRMTARVVGAVARHESEHKSERNRAKATELAEAGKVGGGGARPRGYEKDRKTVREDEADAIRFAAKRILEGASLRQVADEVAVMVPGMITNTYPSSAVSLRRTLIGGRIAGLREHRGEIVGNAEWRAILDRATWEAVRLTLQDPRRKTWRPTTRYLLTGGIAVTASGRPLFARPDGRGHRAYVAAPTDGESGLKIVAEDLEGYVVEAFLEFCDRTPDFKGGAPLDGGPKDGAGKIEALQAELDELADLRGEGEITVREWIAARKPIVKRLEEAQQALALPTGPAVNSHVPQPHEMRAKWPTMTHDQRRASLLRVIRHVYVGPAAKGRHTTIDERVRIDFAA